MLTKPRPIRLNLLPQDPFYDTLPGRVLMWASTVGRYLVIFTELVVIISFATRFKLDRDLTDLNSKITQKAALIESYGNLENEVRMIQKKTEFLKQADDALAPTATLAIISSTAPPDVVLEGIQFRDGSVTFNGIAPTSRSLAQYILALQANPEVRTVSVDSVKSAEGGASGFAFTMRIAVGDPPVAPKSPTTPIPVQDDEGATI